MFTILVDGNWGEWSQYDECSVTCGDGGIRTRNRKCNNPSPKNGGKLCKGSDCDVDKCEFVACPKGKIKTICFVYYWKL